MRNLIGILAFLFALESSAFATWSVIAVDRATGRTGNARFYAGGDIVNGGREVVDAAADGKRAALAIIEASNTGEAANA